MRFRHFCGQEITSILEALAALRVAVFCEYPCLPPFSDEMNSLQEPFLAKGLNSELFFYFGESLILPDYRGHGYDHLFFDEREKEALKWNRYTQCCFCAVDRPDNHPLRPADYRSLEPFWQKRGYEKREDLKCRLYWPDLDDSQQTAKSLTFWLKTIN
ncbi:MAG TPA: GNAT family N-acetyltransferase [Candidatus Marinimicrobia bacterium]|nr:GNAT family N-acetyltransferase [Candidatus Neomarinimicrobiota bacterium]